MTCRSGQLVKLVAAGGWRVTDSHKKIRQQEASLTSCLTLGEETVPSADRGKKQEELQALEVIQKRRLHLSSVGRWRGSLEYWADAKPRH